MLLRRDEIRIRDPFVVPIASAHQYYLYGTTDVEVWEPPAEGFDTYVSQDLNHWDGPFAAFRRPDEFWADRNFWAPEVYRYGDGPNGVRYAMFASFKAPGVARGTQVLMSKTPRGPFKAHSDGPVTPPDWECLDGTLFLDEDGAPWMVFCHEWVQVGDGEMHAMPLTPDVSRASGEPTLLFHASDAPWTAEVTGYGTQGYVTDGPFLYRAANGELLMLWSSFNGEGYAMGIARSTSGSIMGPWTHDDDPLIARDGGHGMLFRTFEGQLMVSFHRPNTSPLERLHLAPVSEEDGQLRLL